MNEDEYFNALMKGLKALMLEEPNNYGQMIYDYDAYDSADTNDSVERYRRYAVMRPRYHCPWQTYLFAVDPNISVELCTGEAWRAAGVARSPSHESVTTELSLFSVSSAASDARVLRLLACKAGQGPDPSLRVASPNPEGKMVKRGSCALPLQSTDACRELLAGCAVLCAQLGLRRSFSAGDVAQPATCKPTRRRGSCALPLQSTDACRELLAGCAVLCAQLGLRRSFSAGDVAQPATCKPTRRRGSCALPLQSTDACRELLAGCAVLCAQLGLRRSFSAGDVAQPATCKPTRSATSEVGLCAALEALTMTAASRSCSTWVAVGGSQLPSPQRSHPAQPPQRPLPSDNKKVRQNYIKRRLLTTYRALERMSQSEFNLDKLEAVASAAVDNTDPGPTTLAVPTVTKTNTKFVHPEAAQLALTAADLERERGRPLSKYERNMMIFNWLHTLDEAAPF
ncbi:uncharacterized protein [Maniola hyperantus]|uniref:uncharacterized protein n=1 Tax=Aphantopus hyperantus TaxID=2795564 RepID=UPI003749450D